MDIDFLIESGNKIISLELIKINSNHIKAHRFDGFTQVIYYDRAWALLRGSIHVESVMSMIKLKAVGHRTLTLYLIILELSSIYRKQITQKIYNNFISMADNFEFKRINAIISEHDLGIVTKN